MTSRQVMTVAVLAAVLVWSTVMTVLGHLAAVAALLPSLGLLIQQIVTAFHGTDRRQNTAAVPPVSDPAAAREEPSR
ncbi:hypothetical protein [Streptomyces sp. NPDC050388]|uniref:hypothetical protein n=1 Tax=Streptomyces sp. NPDC050388 TaxID=3155781 RepID=UPI0034437229